MIEARISDRYGDRLGVAIHDTEHPNFEANLATALVERWGMVAGESDGEDSAGRQKLRLATPKELALRACNTASEVAAEIRKRGWFVAVPTLDEIEVESKKRKGE